VRYEELQQERSPREPSPASTLYPWHMGSTEKTLLRTVLVFRLVAFVWMAILAGVTLVTDAEANDTYVWGSLLAGLVFTFVAISRGTGRPEFIRGWRFLAIDGVVALGIALAPWLAGASNIYFGGYPISWLMFVIFALRLRFAIVGVALLIASQILGANVSPQPFDAIALVRSMLSNVVVVSILGLGFRWLRVMDRRREAAEQELAEEREHRVRSEERAKLAGKLHDSAIQTLVVLQGNADEPEQVRRLARRQERELRFLLSDMRADGQVRLADSLRAAANDVEDLHDVRIERVIIGDIDETGITDAVTTAAREALVNAAKHSGESKVHLFAEVTASTVTVLIRDRGVGFAPDGQNEGFGLRSSIRGPIEQAGGSVEIRSSVGRGTAVELSVPRSFS
jgi:signal transduction histidine kinase